MVTRAAAPHFKSCYLVDDLPDEASLLLSKQGFVMVVVGRWPVWERAVILGRTVYSAVGKKFSTVSHLMHGGVIVEWVSPYQDWRDKLD